MQQLQHLQQRLGLRSHTLLEAHQVATPESCFKIKIRTYSYETPRVCVCDCTLGILCEILRVCVCPYTNTYICVLMLTGQGSCFSAANTQ
jgi:hypothetical protein